MQKLLFVAFTANNLKYTIIFSISYIILICMHKILSYFIIFFGIARLLFSGTLIKSNFFGNIDGPATWGLCSY